MKKKIFSIIGVALFSVAVAINLKTSFNDKHQIDLSLINSEALADGEGLPDGLYVVCIPDENSICIYLGIVVMRCYYSPH